MKKYLSILLLMLMALAVSERGVADSGPSYIRSAVHNGNRVMTVFSNYGVIGAPIDTRPRGAWIYPSNGYIGDVSPMVGAEVKKNGITFHHIITCPVDFRPQTNPRDQDPITGLDWSFMPEGGYFNPNKQSVAMSDDNTTWPAQWPDKLNDLNDPGWPGSWNGYFGKHSSADQESYFVLDDNNDKRFNFANNNTLGMAFKPDSTNLSRNGLALEMKVRGMQWAQLLAQDNIFWLYEISNTGTTSYDRAFFGMVVGTYVGVTGSTDFHEYDDDWSFYNVEENITYTGDFPRDNSRNPFWVGPVGMVGYAFLESPGNPFDGIDNDGDADNSLTGASSPYFTAADFDSVTIKAGNTYILIDENYGRHAFKMPNKDTTVTTRGLAPITLKVGMKLGEGGLVTVNNVETVNPNAYDGADNDLDGLIDENYYLHYHQIKKTSDNPPVVLIDILRPVRHRDYSINQQIDAFSMIDEKRDDLIDNDHDWDINFDDVGRDGIAGTSDYGELDGLPTSGYLASGFDTGLPGEPHIDKTDVKESDQIGLTSFQYFTPSNDISFGDKEALWKRYAPGFFAVPKSIVNNEPLYGEDGDFLLGSGYFPLRAQHTERFSMALVYGGGNGGSRADDVADLLKHKQTVQKIYNANYQFPIPPQPAPTLTAVAGDGQVHLYWDRKSEDAIDPVLRVKDFQGYKIFKATDQSFNDAFDVTNANGVKKGYQPTFQVDKKDTVQGYFRAPASLYNSTEGFTYYLGGNTGLVHDTTDRNVINGRTYYYAIVAYDNGDENVGILPSQNNWKIEVDAAGRITGHSQNIAIVVPGVKSIGYQAPAGSVPVAPVATVATGSLLYKVMDDSKITAHAYEVTFADARDSGKVVPITTTYNVRDTEFYTGIFTPNRIDTIISTLPRAALVPGSVTISKLDGTVVPASSYTMNYERGTLKSTKLFALQPDTVNLQKLQVRYQYYPVFRSKNILGSPYSTETKDSDIFDGVQLYFNNYWTVAPIDTQIRFNTSKPSYALSVSTIAVDLADGTHLTPTRYPADYDIIFSNSVVDSSRGDLVGDVVTPTKFRIYNKTDKKFIQYFFADNDGSGGLTKFDQIYFFDYDSKNKPLYTWFIDVSIPSGRRDTVYNFGTGDTLFVRTTKPFRAGDVYTFTTTKPTINVAARDTLINTIRVVPNPYVVASIREQPVTAGTYGRGERRIEFQNVPADAKVSIFTSRGELVRTLVADGNIANGVIAWDVKSSENLDIAFGVYFYVVESSSGKKTGKLAIIK